MSKVLAIIIGVAGLAGSALAGGVDGSGLVVLNHTSNGALTMSGSSRVTIPSRAVYVNSSSSSAVTTSGSAILDTPNLYLVGGYSFSSTSGCTGAITQSGTPYADPVAGVLIPGPGGAPDLGSVSLSSGSRTIAPGYYSHGISVSGGALTLSPGIYLVGSRFSASSSSSSISGTGVTVVMLSGSLSLSGGATIDFTPTASGNLAGMVIAQPSSNTSQMTLSGGSAMSISGTIYAPGAKVTLSGSSNVTGEGPQLGDLVVSDKVVLSGTGTIKIGHPEMHAIELPKLPLCD